MNKIGKVLSCSPESIVVLVEDLKLFEEHKTDLQVGQYLKIAQGNSDFTIASIRNIRGVSNQSSEGKPEWQFHIECQAVGTIIDGKRFERTGVLLPVPTEPVFPAEKDTLDKLFAEDSSYQFPLGQLSINQETPFMIHGDRFFQQAYRHSRLNWIRKVLHCCKNSSRCGWNRQKS